MNDSTSGTLGNGGSLSLIYDFSFAAASEAVEEEASFDQALLLQTGLEADHFVRTRERSHWLIRKWSRQVAVGASCSRSFGEHFLNTDYRCKSATGVISAGGDSAGETFRDVTSS